MWLLHDLVKRGAETSWNVSTRTSTSLFRSCRLAKSGIPRNLTTPFALSTTPPRKRKNRSKFDINFFRSFLFDTTYLVAQSIANSGVSKAGRCIFVGIAHSPRRVTAVVLKREALAKQSYTLREQRRFRQITETRTLRALFGAECTAADERPWYIPIYNAVAHKSNTRVDAHPVRAKV